MGLDITIYHNPRCSKSRQTLTLLEERGIAPTIVEYLKDGIDSDTLGLLITKLQVEPASILRKKEDAYEAAGLGAESTQEQIIASIIKAPILLERPIVVHGDRAVFGRPPENVLSLLG